MKFLSLFFFLFIYGLSNAQVGIGNTDPKATLDITGSPSNALIADGVIAPRITGNQLTAKDAVYTSDQTGAIVYITSIPTPTTTKTVNITSPGFYYFNGTVWIGLTSPGDMRLVNTSSHITLDAGLGSNGSSAGNDSIIALGSGAGNSNFGKNNIFLGPNAGYNNLNGQDNVFLGKNAGKNNLYSSFNIAIGNSALQSNNNGEENLAIGHNALESDIHGWGNLAIGNYSMKNTSSVSYLNSIIGWHSCSYLTSGWRNTIIGSDAGNNLTSGYNNIAIGSAVDLPNATGNNQLNIGNIIYGNNIDGYSAIVSSGNIGIGIKEPTARLHIFGNNLYMQKIESDNSSGTIFSLANTSTGGNRWDFVSTNGGAFAPSGSLLIKNNNVTGMVIDSDGNVGIGNGGITSGKLLVSGGKIKIDIAQTLTINPNDNFTYASNTMSHYGIGWFDDSWSAVGSTAYLSGYAGIKFFTQGSLGMSINQAGTTSNTSGSWSTFSDARIKTVKSEFKDGLSIIKQINPVTFVYNENAPFKASQTQIGIVAQELEKIAPYMVTKTANGEIEDLREVNNQAYVFLLINAVKEQQIEIENLKNEVKKLKK